MGFDVWKTGVKAKIGLLKADIVGNYREKETNKYIRKTKQEANPTIVTTKEDLKYYLKKKYNLIYIEGELYHEMEQKDYKKILNSVGKTMSKVGKNTKEKPKMSYGMIVTVIVIVLGLCLVFFFTKEVVLSFVKILFSRGCRLYVRRVL